MDYAHELWPYQVVQVVARNDETLTDEADGVPPSAERDMVALALCWCRPEPSLSESTT